MFDILQLGEVDGFLGQDRLVVTPDGVGRGIDRPGSGHDKERSGRLEHIFIFSWIVSALGTTLIGQFLSTFRIFSYFVGGSITLWFDLLFYLFGLIQLLCFC